jgi:hypothetical protein
MDKLLEFSLDPSVENYNKIVSSKKTQNTLAEFFTAWQPAVLLQHYDDPAWEAVEKKPKSILEEEVKKIKVDVMSKLVALPRLGLLFYAWGLFFATGELSYLESAFEVAGNSRSSGSVKSIAIKLFEDTKDYYNGVENVHEMRNKSACFAAFGDMQDTISDKEKVLKELESENLFRKYVGETKQKFPELAQETPEERKEKKKVREAGRLFDKIADDIFNKVV